MKKALVLQGGGAKGAYAAGAIKALTQKGIYFINIKIEKIKRKIINIFSIFFILHHLFVNKMRVQKCTLILYFIKNYI